MLKILSYVLALATLLVTLKSQAYFDPLAFIDLSSILILGLPSILCLLNFNGKELKQSVQAVFSAQAPGESVLTTTSHLLTSLGKYQLNMMFFMWLIALIVMLPVSPSHLMPSVGHQLAIMLISSIYLICFKLCVLLPMQSQVQRKLILQQSQVN